MTRRLPANVLSMRCICCVVVACVAQTARTPLCAARSDQRARLVTGPKVRDNLAVTFEIPTPQVVEETTPLSDHLEQPATAVVILRVGAEVVGEIIDSCGEKCDLNCARAAVVFVCAVLLYGGGLLECLLFGFDLAPAYLGAPVPG